MFAADAITDPVTDAGAVQLRKAPGSRADGHATRRGDEYFLRRGCLH
ncbi:hypothetical protein HMPREF0297_1741 [Corynebacterium jeikeium ATCC 43734]|nr:hypothetical protein HMPREF0297_1741 [Corynebacterium jeikeium ATCC 43734]SQI19331.1 Uncharacterised protein [Corynebacterium jeikeium]